MADLSALEPMAGAGLAISLAYLALERFRYRRDVEGVACDLHKKYESNEALEGDETLEHLNELKWLCRKPANGHKPSGFLANAYWGLYRWHGDVLILSGLSAICALVLILGVAGQADIIAKIEAATLIEWGFWMCAAAITFPGGAVILGWRCKIWATKRAQTCEQQIAHALKLSAQAARAPSNDPMRYSAEEAVRRLREERQRGARN